jgi:hypothetical protein
MCHYQQLASGRPEWQTVMERAGEQQRLGQREQMNRKVQAFLPMRLHHLTAHDVGFASETEFCEARGLLTGYFSSFYDVAHGLHHLNELVAIAVGASPDSPFLSALVYVLFFHDASGPLHYLLMKQRWKENDVVYASCANPSLVRVTYDDSISNKTLDERWKMHTIPEREHEGMAAKYLKYSWHAVAADWKTL